LSQNRRHKRMSGDEEWEEYYEEEEKWE